jgi:hypothetical protein
MANCTYFPLRVCGSREIFCECLKDLGKRNEQIWWSLVGRVETIAETMLSKEEMDLRQADQHYIMFSP